MQPNVQYDDARLEGRLFRRQDDGVQVQAYVLPDVPGLGVSRRGVGWWTIYHLASGARLTEDAWPTRPAALAAMQGLAGLANWKEPLERLTARPRVRMQVRRVLDAAVAA